MLTFFFLSRRKCEIVHVTVSQNILNYTEAQYVHSMDLSTCCGEIAGKNVGFCVYTPHTLNVGICRY